MTAAISTPNAPTPPRSSAAGGLEKVVVPDGRVLLEEADEAGRPVVEEEEPVAPAAEVVPEVDDAPDEEVPDDDVEEDFASPPGFAEVVLAEE